MDSQKKLSTQPYKGARDFYPQEMQTRNYIFEVWKRVCRRFGFEEYDFPILEPLEIFAAKTGQEVVNEQLFSLEDRGKRMLAIRPELTPGTVRMIAQKYNELLKPIKWFMVGNNWRYEKPQTGRGREFYQLEANIFGVDSVTADLEIFSLIIEIMREFGAVKEQFGLRFSDRKLLNALLTDTLKLDNEQALRTRRIMDRYLKMDAETFSKELQTIEIAPEQIKKIQAFLSADSLQQLDKVIDPKILTENKGYSDLKSLIQMLGKANLLEYCSFGPTIIRGFDYSDGIVYEVYDKNPNNRRSLFGGERFDKLIQIFGPYNLAATGFAMGDWTLLEFLKNWDLLPDYKNETQIMLTLWPSEDQKYLYKSFELACEIRKSGVNVFTWIDTNTKLDKQLKYADKKRIPYAVIVGESELTSDRLTVKDLFKQTQQTLSGKEFLKWLEGLK